MFRKLTKGKKIKGLLSVLLQMWTGILLIYTFEVNSVVGFLMSAVLWRLVEFDSKQKLNIKKLSLIALLIVVSEHYKASEFAFNAAIGFTVFQALSFFSKSKFESRQNWLLIVYVSMVIYYTLRMTLVFEVPEILTPIHVWYVSIEKFLSANQTVKWIILMSFVVLDMAIFLKQGKQEKLPLIMGLISGLCGLEDMSAIIIMSIVDKVIFKAKNGVGKKMNVKNLFSKPEKFTNYEAESPAARAARKWDEREGEIIVQNYNLRRLLVGMMAVVMFMTVGLVYKSLSSNVMPYIVEVDTTTGMVRNVGTVEASKHYQAGESVYKYFLSRFLKNAREIPLDPVVYKENLTTSYGFLTRDAAKKLQTMLKTEKLTEKFGHQTVQINISTILPMEGGHSYQIRWTEETFTISNGEKKVTPYSGIFTVQIIRSDDEAKLVINPIGMYISDFSWSKDASAVNTESTTNVNIK